MPEQLDGLGADCGLVRVAICIATCRRPEGLRRLLHSLNELRIPEAGAGLRIVVVDNDPESPAVETLGDMAMLSRWPLTYAFEHVRGVVAARNALLRLVPENTDFIAFLDDDEVVVPEWLDAMISTQKATGATAVQGPVIAEFEETPPEWLAEVGLFKLGPFTQGEPLNFAATNNVIVSKHFLDAHQLRFDPSFNLSGGEDEELFTRLRKIGGTIVASSDALVIDKIPKSRMSLRWILRRSHRMGNTLGRIAIQHNTRKAERLTKGLAATCFGLGRMATAGILSPRHRVAGAIELARGTGMLTAFLGVHFVEYSSAAVSFDRGEKV